MPRRRVPPDFGWLAGLAAAVGVTWTTVVAAGGADVGFGPAAAAGGVVGAAGGVVGATGGVFGAGGGAVAGWGAAQAASSVIPSEDKAPCNAARRVIEWVIEAFIYSRNTLTEGWPA